MKYLWHRMNDEQKYKAWEEEVRLATHNGTSKEDLINILKWLWEKFGHQIKKESVNELALARSYNALTAILNERSRQDERWGEQNHYTQFWMGILGEEYGELCEAVNETVFNNGTDKGGYENMRKEAVQVAAVAFAFIECLDRNKEKWEL